jgi:IS4 transposase
VLIVPIVLAMWCAWSPSGWVEPIYQYITNVLSPTQLSLHEIVVLYARRWDIEMAFKLIKRELGLHLFWSAKTSVLPQQVWAVLLISQILHALQMEFAGKAG